MINKMLVFAQIVMPCYVGETKTEQDGLPGKERSDTTFLLFLVIQSEEKPRMITN